MPSRQYAPKDFLRRVPNRLSGRYFHERGLLTHLDFTQLSETDVAPIFEAWQSLPPAPRAAVDSDFRMVYSLSDEAGVQAILEEARYHGEDLAPEFSARADHYDRVLWTFLERPWYLEVAVRFRGADTLPRRYWHRRNGIPLVQPRDPHLVQQELADTLRAYFKPQGRGHSCQVEVYPRGDLIYYFAYPEDYGNVEIEWDESNLTRRAHRPVFEVVFVYRPERGSLDTYFEGGKDAAAELTQVFGRVALGIELGEPYQDERVYELNRLKDRDFLFSYSPDTSIEDLRVKLLQLSVLGNRRWRHTLDADMAQDREEIYNALDATFNTGAGPVLAGDPRVPLALLNVTRAGLVATFAGGHGRRRRSRTFYLGYPNRCTLDHEGQDALLRQVLIDSGLERSGPQCRSPRKMDTCKVIFAR